MSNIFDALRKTRGDLADVIVGSHGQDKAPVQAPPTASEILSSLLPPIGEADTPATPGKGVDNRILGPAIRILPLSIRGAAPIFPYDATSKEASEHYRILRTKIIQHPKKPRTIILSSASPGDGKTVTAINLAAALSLKSLTLLVDGDFRRPSIARELGLPETPGLAEVLEGVALADEAMIRLQQYPNLYVIPAGKSRFNPAELLDSARWGAFCAAARETFEYIIIDSPPVAAVADYDLLQAAVDGILLVAQPDHTKRKLLLGALELVAKDKLLGVALNALRPWIFAPKHPNQYGYY
jgi:capsular exopolysaccharide synthesis family protein